MTMDDDYSSVSILVLVGLILLETVFYDFDAAVQNVNEGRLEDEVEEGNRKTTHLLETVDRLGRFMYIVQITTHLIGVITGAVILPVQVDGLMRRVHIFEPLAWWKPSTAATLWYLDSARRGQILFMAAVTVILLLIIISFGIIIPRRLAVKEPEKWGYHTLPIVLFTAGMFPPLTKLTTLLFTLVLEPSGVEITDDDDSVTEEDIMSMVSEGHERGILETNGTGTIANTLELGDKEVSDIMTHCTNMTVLDGTMSLREAADSVLNEGINTRYPVYGEDIDDITETLHMRDAMVCVEKAEYKDKPLMETPGLLRKASFIPEAGSTDTLLKEIQSGKIHVEIVVDEYGQIVGLLTIKDILRETVENILGEYDEKEDFVAAAEDGSYIMSDLMPLDSAMEILDIEFPEEDSDTYDTLNGYLISRPDRVPQERGNPRVDFGGYTFEVIKAGNKMIESVLVFKRLSQERGSSGKGKENPRSDRLGEGLVEDRYERSDREHEGGVS